MTGQQQMSTLWMLVGQFGQTMSLEQIRNTFYPTLSLKTMHNKACKGELPTRTGDVFDVRDVAAWWDNQRTQTRAA